LAHIENTFSPATAGTRLTEPPPGGSRLLDAR
jgi:hypothetical protein